MPIYGSKKKVPPILLRSVVSWYKLILESCVIVVTILHPLPSLHAIP